MTLFEFYEREAKQELDIISLKWELVGMHILYYKRKNREARARVKAGIRKFKAFKKEHPLTYKKVWNLAFDAAPYLIVSLKV